MSYLLYQRNSNTLKFVANASLLHKTFQSNGINILIESRHMFRHTEITSFTKIKTL